MPRFEVVRRTILEMHLGTFEAKDETHALEQAWMAIDAGKAPGPGSPCHHCTTDCGDVVDPEDGAILAD